MEQHLAKLKNLLAPRQSLLFDGGATDGEPQIGFKVMFAEETKQLKVRVIAARHLPTAYGAAKPRGYSVKVRVFPEREKFETRVAQESWPTFNEEFVFSLHAPPSSPDPFKGKFVSLTVYAVLESATEPVARTSGLLGRLLGLPGRSGGAGSSGGRGGARCALSNRRTVGAATYNLDRKAFTQRLGQGGGVATPDLWRRIQEITSGVATEPREGKKGSVEVTLSYAVSEDGKNDVVEVGVTKLRCTVQTMQEHEKLGGQLYIKIEASENDEHVQKMKSDRFEPTIALRIEPNTATLRANINNCSIDQVKIQIRLLCKTALGKKTQLGRIEINSKSSIWKEIVQTPSVSITRMMNFE